MSKVAVLRATIEGGSAPLYRLETGEAALVERVARPAESCATPELPGAIEAELRRWAMAETGLRTLCVAAEGDALVPLAWEEVPRSLGLDRLAVARLSLDADAQWPAPETRAHRRPTAVVAGWSRRHGRTLAGVSRELLALGEAFAKEDLVVSTMPDPTPERLAPAFKDSSPVLVHLAHPGVDGAADDPGLSVPGADGQARRLTQSELGDMLLSTPSTPPPAPR
jgi:hypothetical protein